MNKLIAKIQAYRMSEDGATAIEYGLIAGGIALAIVAILFLVGDNLNEMFTTVGDKVSEANQNAQG